MTSLQLKTNSSNSHQKLLQSCLSLSWGGLEMVAYEDAVALAKNNVECYTLCVEGSPLANHLAAAKLPMFTVSTKHGFFDFIRVRKFILKNGITTILVQTLKDLRMLALSTFQQKNMHIIGISHTFVDVNKQDFLHRWCYRKLEKLICLTDRHKINLLSHLPVLEGQMEVIPNYVDCQRFSPHHRSEEMRAEFGAEAGSLLVGIASRLDPQKGQDCALQAMALLKKTNPSVRLVIIGENTLHETNYLQALKSMAKAMDIEDRVHFTGYRADMEKVMASLDVLVLPSHCETFGRVLIEAMASKTAVIATNAGGVPDIVEPGINGLLVNPKNPEELAAAIDNLSQDELLRTRLITEGYSRVREAYDQAVVEKRFLRIVMSAH